MLHKIITSRVYFKPYTLNNFRFDVGSHLKRHEPQVGESMRPGLDHLRGPILFRIICNFTTHFVSLILSFVLCRSGHLLSWLPFFPTPGFRRTTSTFINASDRWFLKRATIWPQSFCDCRYWADYVQGWLLNCQSQAFVPGSWVCPAHNFIKTLKDAGINIGGLDSSASFRLRRL